MFRMATARGSSGLAKAMTPFLTDLDPQAAIKGSRDPLGVQTVWARLGRQVVGNLTTVTTSVRDFTTTILGYYFAERVANEARSEGDLAVFLRWEQLAAYARGEVNGDFAFRGVDRVKKNLIEGATVRLGVDSTAQILSNQKTYGLWGLYSVASRSSGFVEGEPTRVTKLGRELIEKHYLPAFTAAGLRNADAIVTLLAKSKTDLDINRSGRRLLEGVAKVLTPELTAYERDVYRRHLLLGGDLDKTVGGQKILVAAMESTLGDDQWAMTPPSIRHLAKRCRTQGDVGATVADRIEKIRTAELLLAPASELFGLLLASHGQTVAEISKVALRQWGASMPTIDVAATEALQNDLRDSSGEPETGRRWVQLARVMAGGDYNQAFGLLMDQNRFVMKVRGGGPWVDLDNGKLRVRFGDDNTATLSKKSELPTLWRHSYFLDSLRAMTLALKA